MPEDALLIGTIRTVSAKTRAAVVAGVEADRDKHRRGARLRRRSRDDPRLSRHRERRHDGGLHARRSQPICWRDTLVRVMPAPVMGAEDFSYVLDEVPGAMAFLGTMPADHGGFVAPNHSNRMVINEDAHGHGRRDVRGARRCTSPRPSPPRSDQRSRSFPTCVVDAVAPGGRICHRARVDATRLRRLGGRDERRVAANRPGTRLHASPPRRSPARRWPASKRRWPTAPMASSCRPAAAPR